MKIVSSALWLSCILSSAAADQPSPAALAKAVLQRYGTFSIPEQQAAIAGLAVRVETAGLLLDAMEQPQAQPAARVSRAGVELLNPHPRCLAEIAIEYPYLQYRYEQFRGSMWILRKFLLRLMIKPIRFNPREPVPADKSNRGDQDTKTDRQPTAPSLRLN